MWITEESNHVDGDRYRSQHRRESACRGRRATILGPLAVGGGAVWVDGPREREACGGISGTKRTAIELDTWVGGVSFGAGAVWVTNEIADTVYRIDPHDEHASTNRRPLLPAWCRSGRRSCLGDNGGATVARLPRFPTPVCSDVYFDRDGRARRPARLRPHPQGGRSREHAADGGRDALRPRAARASRRAPSPSGTSRATTRQRRRAASTSSAAQRTPRRTHATCVSLPSSARSRRRARTRRSRSRTRPRMGRSRCSARRTRTRASRPTTTCTRPAREASFAWRRREAWTGARRSARKRARPRPHLSPDVEVGGVRPSFFDSARSSRETPRRRRSSGRPSSTTRPRATRTWCARSRGSGLGRSRSRPCSLPARARSCETCTPLWGLMFPFSRQTASA